MRTSVGTASSDPPVITGRGPYRSSIRPTGIPTTADTNRPVEKAAVQAVFGLPGVRCDVGQGHREGVVQHPPAGDLGQTPRGQRPAERTLTVVGGADPHRVPVVANRSPR